MGLREKTKGKKMKDQKAKSRKRKVKTYSEELVDFCEEMLGESSMIAAADAFANWEGEYQLENLPPDAPKGLRDKIAAVNKVFKEGKPAFDALTKELEKIAG